MIDDCETVLEIRLVSEYIRDIELETDTWALWDDRLLVDGDELIDIEEDGDRLPLTLIEIVFVTVVRGLTVDWIVGVITAVFNAVEEVDNVMIPVTDMKEVIEGVTVFCKDEVTVAVSE